MEYQKRLRLIDFVKNNFTVKKNEIIVIHYQNFESLELITAEKVDFEKIEFGNYIDLRDKLGLGCCYLSDVFNNKGPRIDFYDDYITYRGYISTNTCLLNYLEESPFGLKVEIISEVDQMIRELNGEEPIYRPSNC